MASIEGGTLGLPAGLPATDYLAINPNEESGEPGQTGAFQVEGAPGSYNPLVRWIQKQLAQHEPKVQLWRDKAKECYRFRDGKQLSDEDANVLRSSNRPIVAFNSVQKYIKFIGGVQRMTPQALIYAARNVEDQNSAIKGELRTKFYEYIMGTVNQGAAERSRAFDDMNVSGMGWTNCWTSRSRNPRGEVMYQWTDNQQMLWPENSRQNLDGSKWIGRESDMDLEESINRWPEMAMYLRAAAGTGDSEDQIPDFGYADSRRPIPYVVPWLVTAPLNKTPGAGRPAKPGKVSILEWQYWQDRQGYYFFDPLERTDAWLATREFQRYRQRLQRLGMRITDWDSQLHRVYYRTFLLQRRIMLEEPKHLPIEGNFTYNCMTAHWDNQDKIWYGIMRVLMDPQRYANMFLRQVVEIMGAQSKGGYDAEAGAATAGQRQAIEANSAKPGSVNIWNVGAISEGRVKPKTLPQIPEGSLAVLQFCMKSFDDVSGIASQSFGMSVAGQTPGVTLRRQMLAGLLILANEFESLSRFRKKEGEIIADFMPLVADNRVIRIGGPFDSQALKLDPKMFQDKHWEYDVELDEVEHDPTMRQLYADTVTQIMPTLIRTGKFIPELLDYMPLPVQIRQKLKQSIMQAAQMQQQAMAMGLPMPGGRGKPRSMQEIQADIAKVHSQASLNQAKALHLTHQARDIGAERHVKDLRELFDSLLDAGRFHLERQKLNLERAKAGHDATHKHDANALTAMKIAAEAMRPEVQA